MRGHAALHLSRLLAGICLLATACSSYLTTPGGSQSPASLLLSTPSATPFQPFALPATSANLAESLPPATALPAEVALGTPSGVPLSPQASPSPLPSQEARISVWVDPSLPSGLRSALALPDALYPVEAAPGADPAALASTAPLRLEVSAEQPLSRWVYAVASPFATLPDGISFEALQLAWRGESAGPFAGQPLLMDENTRAVLSKAWGAPGAQALNVLPAAELLNYAWAHRPAWAILPFEALEPGWKVLQVDGASPLHKDFDLLSYPLAIPVGLDGDPTLAGAIRNLHGAGSAAPLLPATNRDPQLLTVLAMTGVTALVRATAATMEQRGILYPGQDVGAWLRSADLTHISNEVPFAQDCPYPDPFQADMRFCSDPRYIALMEDVGTDIVELTGDHFADWGTAAMRDTLEMYRQRGWLYYGGGENLEAGRQAITVEHNGNRLAFIGCNAKGGSFAQAGPNHPGAVTCDLGWMAGEVARLRNAGYLPIVTFQHFEYYTYKAQPDQKRDFRAMAEAGAVIVSGSQAHQPQALEFDQGALVHYGLGNLFFDQYEVSEATRQGFIDRHIFYAGRYISTELLPILFVDYARPRPMTAEEHDQLLNAVFKASGW